MNLKRKRKLAKQRKQVFKATGIFNLAKVVTDAIRHFFTSNNHLENKPYRYFRKAQVIGAIHINGRYRYRLVAKHPELPNTFFYEQLNYSK